MTGGFEGEILRVLESKFNFQSNFLDGKQTWGAIVNGTWVGLVKQILDKVMLLHAG